MAKQEIRESSSYTEGGGSSSSVIQVGYELFINEEEILDSSSPLVFRVPKSLRDCNDHFYTPHLVSIGPFHYGKPELWGMEKYKSEAVRRMQKRIKNNVQHGTIKSVVEDVILKKDTIIRQFYGETILYNPLQLAWMVTRDACFILEFIVAYSKNINPLKSVYEQLRFPSSENHPVFDIWFTNPTRARLMDDILLIENQVPLFILKHLLQCQMGSADAGDKKLEAIMNCLVVGTTRQNAFEWFVGYPCNECCHVLDVVYQGMFGQHFNSYMKEARKLFPPSDRCVPVRFKNGVDWIKANFTTIFTSSCKMCSKWMTRLLSIFPTSNSDVDVFFVKLPSAVELINAGVKVQPVLFNDLRKGGQAGYPAIQWIRFDEKTSTLYLPEVTVTTQSESLMRSIIAMEVSSSSRYPCRPMAQYAKLMDELVDNEEDVSVLRDAGIIKNDMGSNQEAARVFNSLTKEIIYSPGCKPIDDARFWLHKYTKRKYKILWSEFVTAYFSKPWLVAGSIAATMLLLMTVVQVFCLFYKCGA